MDKNWKNCPENWDNWEINRAFSFYLYEQKIHYLYRTTSVRLANIYYVNRIKN